jgi:hypothetical protein
VRRARVSGFRLAFAREPVREKVGHEQQRRGALQATRALEREQLEERIDRQELNPCGRVDLLAGYARQRIGHDGAATAVAIRERVAEQGAAFVQEPEIDGP